MTAPSPRSITAFAGDHRWLSNFWYARVTLDGVSYPTVENAYQAAKTLNLEARHQFERCTPGDAKRLGKRLVLRADWDRVKLAVMRDLIAQKFARGTRLADQLLTTGTAELVEGNRWGDRYWGVCQGEGQNHLGRLLMEQRAYLGGQPAQPSRQGPTPANDRTGAF